MRLGFSKLLVKLLVKYVFTYTKGKLEKKTKNEKKTTKKTISKGLICNDAYAMFSLCFLLIFFIKAYVTGTHLNCIDISVQFKSVPITYAFIYKEDKKYTSCNLKTQELFDCGLIRVCAVIW